MNRDAQGRFVVGHKATKNMRRARAINLSALWARPSFRRAWKRSLKTKWTPEARKKLSDTKKRLGQTFVPSRGARKLKRVLGKDWILEYRVPTGRSNLRWHQVDIANPNCRMIIEVDGHSHTRPSQQRRDRFREWDLFQLGWTVIRVKEESVL